MLVCVWLCPCVFVCACTIESVQAAKGGLSSSPQMGGGGGGVICSVHGRACVSTQRPLRVCAPWSVCVLSCTAMNEQPERVG